MNIRSAILMLVIGMTSLISFTEAMPYIESIECSINNNYYGDVYDSNDPSHSHDISCHYGDKIDLNIAGYNPNSEITTMHVCQNDGWNGIDYCFQPGERRTVTYSFPMDLAQYQNSVAINVNIEGDFYAAIFKLS
jgi:hypothetical protein